MSEWQPIKTVPHDEIVLLGVWVKHKRDEESHAQYYCAYYRTEDERVTDPQGDDSLPYDEFSDYDFWMPIPKLPEVK